jgi:nitrogen regulation protein NR(I)
MGTIVVVDDEPNMLTAFQELLGDLEHDVTTARRAETVLEQLDDTVDLVILDVQLPGMSGLEALRQIKHKCPKLPVIIITGHGTMNTAIEATKLGAFDYQLKPIDPDAMLATVDKALTAARLMRGQVVVGAEKPDHGSEAIVGRSAPMQEVYKAIGRVAQTDAAVLIRGESGTGKELVARAIYQHSLRAESPLIIVNCAAIPEPLLESELFGHERGAFTNAVGQRIGKFQQGDEGTIFLDEIGDMPRGIQAKILRVLQDKCFQRVGGNETIHSNVRVLAATNRKLEQAIAEGNFREDLFHRLNVFTIQLPALRDRRDDIPELVDYFVARFAKELKVDAPPLSPQALELLQSHSWPGNVRELEHCIQRLIISTGGHPIQAEELSLLLAQTDQTTPLGMLAADEGMLRTLVQRYLRAAPHSAHERFLERAEALLIGEALRQTRGNQTHAARLLGLPRQTLCDKIRKHDLTSDGGPPPP